jgi:hypothetical protein
LLAQVLRFVERARICPGVRRIALIGSLLTTKASPKDADVLVTVDNDVDLTPLATAGRQLMGGAQNRNHGADIFLADPANRYIGRICQWRECRSGVRQSCDAQHCGRRQYLHDDFGAVTLPAALVQSPPLELWPKVIRRQPIPPDVEIQILQILETGPVFEQTE